MKLEELKLKMGKLLFFDKEAIRNFDSREDVLDANIKYWLKKEKLIALKKGVYIFSDCYQKEGNKNIYLEYLSNQLIKPSYLSVEYVLAKYQLLSEPVNALTAITTKTTREIVNNLGVFRYYSITPELFSGYMVKYFNNNPVLEATKEKALFDFLYLRFLKSKNVSEAEVENLRINWEAISRKDFLKVKSFALSLKSSKVKNVLKLIEKMYYERNT
jgi:hypothetical protein